ncbi:unnamed protein product [Symbiodinium necroappetens]|uniref:Apocarotenoid-15,15'-oxygenase n=1 Tax=Symbiodinium necroappetens TaxID=1628268 RepID=A0A812VS99_9DINO|nr:unnamed protein product [Symbiodinium necroappetens]
MWHARCRRRRRTAIIYRRSLESELEALFLESPWRRGLEPAEESKPTRLSFLGKLPEDLVGTVYRNGPGRIRIGESKYDHWFDGDGFVTSLSVDGRNQEAAFTSRFVKTQRYEVQQKSGELVRTERGSGMASMGAWTPASNGGFLSNVFRLPTNPANTNVLWWDDRLLALCEGGIPYALDPGNLETLGEELFRDPPLSQSGVQFFSAHPKRDPDSGELFNIGLKIGLEPTLEVYKCSANRSLMKRTVLALTDLTFVHDFAITRKHVILIIPPWSCSTTGLAKSLWKGAMAQFFEWKEDAGTRLIVLKRSDLSVVFDSTLQPAVSLYHTVNAYDDDNDAAIWLQIAAHNGPREDVEKNFADMYRSRWSDATRCSLRELRLDLVSGSIRSSALGPEAASSFELPSIHPAFVGRRNEYVWTNAAYPSDAAFLNCVERLDMYGNSVDRATFGPSQFAGEPMIIPKASTSEELAAYMAGFSFV